MRRHGPTCLMAKDPSSHPGRPVVISSVTASSKGLSQQPGRSIKDANYFTPNENGKYERALGMTKDKIDDLKK